jgi:hypothetical protein
LNLTRDEAIANYENSDTNAQIATKSRLISLPGLIGKTYNQLNLIYYFEKKRSGPVLAVPVCMENLIFIGIVFFGLAAFLWMADDRSPRQDE